MRNPFATENRACVVGALAPYNYGLLLAGAEHTEIVEVIQHSQVLPQGFNDPAVFSVDSVFSVAKSFFKRFY
jgi:hypothetical protein